MADKHSHAKMLILVSISMASAPFMTNLSTNLCYIVIINLFAELSVSGTVLLLFNTLLKSTEENIRSLCIYPTIIFYCFYSSTVWCIFIRKNVHSSCNEYIFYN
ncbi:hypothetical protein [Niallia nealsonii]|uniref:NADH dehydrogenase subunit 4L n=1 Tax=Niallia nealsonii TaxID=115979 RepID=A0A2N0YYR4_9BACI|nr:hypothetical protein [Niallia nealsonii]PKG22385.1 hypothetical protein CWS01_17375 [Niallia nealsonii]